MTPHPYYQAVLDAMAAARRPYFHQVTPPQARAMLREGLAAAPAPIDLPDLAAVIDDACDGPHGAIPLRRYLPAGLSLGTCIYLHSGGWVIGDVDFADATCRRICGMAQAELISIDYRKAPEHPYPIPLDDAYAALAWAAANRSGPLVVIGESAGGNLAAACAIRARDSGGPAIAGQLLAYPVTDHDLDTGSYRQIGTRNWLLSTRDMAWFWDQYAPASVDRRDPLLSPLRVADAAGLAPAMILVGELDPLRDEALAYAAKLSAAGVAVVVRRDAGMLHGYLGAAAAVPLAKAALAQAAAWIRQRLGDGDVGQSSV